MITAPQQNWAQYAACTRASDDAWIRRLTVQQRFELYEDMFQFLMSARQGRGDWTKLEATAEDLILMKMLAGRPQDEQDIRGIVIAQRDRLDWDYCLQVADALQQDIGFDLVDRIRALQSSQS